MADLNKGEDVGETQDVGGWKLCSMFAANFVNNARVCEPPKLYYLWRASLFSLSDTFPSHFDLARHIVQNFLRAWAACGFPTFLHFPAIHLISSWSYSFDLVIFPPQSSAKQQWIFLISPGADADKSFPRVGESCKVKLITRGKEDKTDWLQAERVENDVGSMLGAEAEKLAAFLVTIKQSEAGCLKKPLISDDGGGHNRGPKQLYGKKAVLVNIEVAISAKTVEAEIGALDELMSPQSKCSQRQRQAFQYLMNFKNPAFCTNLFEELPWMARPLRENSVVPKSITNLYKDLDDHQKRAYKELLSNLPCGFGILPGGPGAGKTHWNIVVSAMAQSTPMKIIGAQGQALSHNIKILYLLDINKPLDDICTKYLKTYRAIGLRKRFVRLQPSSAQNDDSRNAYRFQITAKLKGKFSSIQRPDVPPTLDEAAWDLYQKHRANRYKELCACLAKLSGQSSGDQRGKTNQDKEKILQRTFKDAVKKLYQDLLENEIDFIFATPVCASYGLKDGHFRPDIVFFDESPHAKECSTLISVAKFEPKAWFFTGDYRQTRPFLVSDKAVDNPYAAQLLTSTMERAANSGAVPVQLLLNHRAYGNLQALGSRLFYQGTMLASQREFPETAEHIRQTYLNPLLGRPFVLHLVGQLAQDAHFKRVGQNKAGSILVIAPYREAVMRYRNAFKNMRLCQENGKEGSSVLCEVRSIETVQGGEADFVIVDFAEVLVMNPRFGSRGYGQQSNYISQVLKEYHDVERQATTIKWHEELPENVLSTDVTMETQKEKENREWLEANTFQRGQALSQSSYLQQNLTIKSSETVARETSFFEPDLICEEMASLTFSKRSTSVENPRFEQIAPGNDADQVAFDGFFW
ncbi:hypothetical protein P8C59_009497 [Phyllachora maydis]|uniref:DNA2/NAM7 helicase helicase domain-containing protein n=1 Tax=Phyllachora maydis TaxID=1825666 RepID=A0AAD9IFB0_9PEZI|nr:hypothetical protein P8C59_009497 [Phyllachora maydis]